MSPTSPWTSPPTVNGSVELLNWKVEAADIRTRNQYLRLEDPITPIRVRPGQPPWPENFVYPATCKDLKAIASHDHLNILLDGYQLPRLGLVRSKPLLRAASRGPAQAEPESEYEEGGLFRT
ncbi:hypothetical protein FA95DRAFT_1682808 [Auriscalpium vulgare]|uniref:Uncharacterized protein n=1 Tax=Auriscalpium vulgare TaxID=40419 RepID=A0ACB8REN0_9AGAM|nr:hypothetical protein FA95DRAFT_1682808 [Auriscalpium vulgare]